MALLEANAARDDWADDPHLSDAQLAALSALSDADIEDALDRATDDDFWHALDQVRSTATAPSTNEWVLWLSARRPLCDFGAISGVALVPDPWVHRGFRRVRAGSITRRS